MRLFYKKSLFCLLFISLILPHFASAFELEAQYPNIEIFGLSLSITKYSSPAEYFRYFFSIGIFVSVTLAALVIIFGGIYYLVSFGKQKFTSEGKDWIKSGISGLIIIMATYLIVYTINPALIYFKIPGLFPPNWQGILPTYFPNNPLPSSNYKEIPLGALTENLLSRKTDCYAFDSAGDPINGEIIKTDDKGNIPGPTFTDHDRVDCVLKLADAIQKKTKVAKDLSDAITNIMKQCNCSDSKDDKGNLFCDKDCTDDTEKQCDNPPSSDKKCTGECAQKACKISDKITDKNAYCCPAGVKEQIEHGKPPIVLGGNGAGCNEPEKKYAGLDEFRTSLSAENIVNLVEEQHMIDKRNIITINQQNWNNLKLIEQLMYLNEKINRMKKIIDEDLKQLKNAGKEMANCYTVKSSVDFLKISEKTSKDEKTIKAIKTFSDSETGEPVNSSKYCDGFNYGNSSCYKACQDICPDTEKDIFGYNNCYLNCQNNASCLKKQEKCLQSWFNNKKCSGDTFSNFGECVTSCRNQCKDACSKIYSNCSNSDELKLCQQQCGDNSKCLLGDETTLGSINTCLYTPPTRGLYGPENQCLNLSNDKSNLENCINNSYQCKYGSYQYAGYADCVEYGKNYSSSYLYKHPEVQKCPYPYLPNPYSSLCYNSEQPARCEYMCPETTKCPASSKCPDCPCGVTDTNNIKEYRVVESDCGQYSYNGDPLTFYCRSAWEPEAPVTGKWNPISKSDEIPIGQTVDDSQKWAQALSKAIDDFSKKVDNKDNDDDKKGIIQFLKKIGDEKNYCKCNSTFEDGKPVCHTDCLYTESEGKSPFCIFSPCSGNPCQKMIDLLSKVSDQYNKIKDAYITFYNSSTGSLSDILKKLTYSRKQMSKCSQQIVSFTGNIGIVSTINCTRAFREGFLNSKTFPITTETPAGCYGQLAGIFINKNDQPQLTDNWFCASMLVK